MAREPRPAAGLLGQRGSHRRPASETGCRSDFALLGKVVRSCIPITRINKLATPELEDRTARPDRKDHSKKG